MCTLFQLVAIYVSAWAFNFVRDAGSDSKIYRHKNESKICMTKDNFDK
jgi:hypothetical protein